MYITFNTHSKLQAFIKVTYNLYLKKPTIHITHTTNNKPRYIHQNHIKHNNIM